MNRAERNVIYLQGREVPSVQPLLADPLLHELQKLLKSPAEKPLRAPKMATNEELTDAKLRAVSAETDTKIARLEGKLDLVISKLDAVANANAETKKELKDDGRHTRANIVVVGVSLALLVVGVAAFAPVVFDLGMKTREAITKEIQEQLHK